MLNVKRGGNFRYTKSTKTRDITKFTVKNFFPLLVSKRSSIASEEYLSSDVICIKIGYAIPNKREMKVTQSVK